MLGEGEFIPVYNLAPYHEYVWHNGGTSSCITNLNTRWRCLVSVRPCLLYNQRKSPVPRMDLVTVKSVAPFEFINDV